MSHLNNDKCVEIYNDLHTIIGKYILLGYPEEAYESILFLLGSSITTRCIMDKGNLEQWMQEAFDKTADYTYHIAEEFNRKTEEGIRE